MKHLHGFIFIFSIGMTLIMLALIASEIYPDVFCLICAVTSLLNTQYAACMLVDCNKEIEKEGR